MTTINEQTCQRCGYQWLPRSTNRPGVCPRCKSYYWDKPYKRMPKEKETNVSDSKLATIVKLVQAQDSAISESAITGYINADWDNADEHQDWLHTASSNEIAGWVYEGLRNWHSDDETTED